MTDFTRTLETLELVGGSLCLDFVNTINSRLDPEHDYLSHYTDLIGWAGKAGILPPKQAGQLQKQSRQDVQGTERAMHAALQMRELLYRIFSRAAKGSEPNRKDLEMFLTAYAEVFARGQLVKADEHYQITWKLDETLDALLLPIVHSAGQILHSGELTHVKECPGCGWLFLDTSKNQSRRWCSMNTCGARDKMRRYHKRQRAS